jgi:hypothetical protein
LPSVIGRAPRLGVDRVLEAGAPRVRRGAHAGQRRLQALAVRRNDAPVEPGDGQRVAGFDDRVLRFAVELGVRLLKPRDLLAGFRRLAVVDEVRDRDALRQFLEPAHVIHVVVRGDGVVDLLHARIRQREHQPIGVAPSRIAAVDEDGLAGWRDIQHRFAAFGIDDVNLERL